MTKVHVSSGCKWATALQAADLGVYCCGTAEQCQAVLSCATQSGAGCSGLSPSMCAMCRVLQGRATSFN